MYLLLPWGPKVRRCGLHELPLGYIREEPLGPEFTGLWTNGHGGTTATEEEDD